MYAIDEATRQLKNLVIKDGTDRLLVDAAGVTLTAEDITLDLTDTNAKLDTINTNLVAIQAQNDDIIALLTTIADNTAP